MKYIDIKKDALRLMGVTPDTQSGEYASSNLTDYFSGMDSSILRAIDRMKSLGAIPSKTKSFPIVEKSNFYNFTLSDLKINGEIKFIKKIEGNTTEETPFVILNEKIYAYFEKNKTYFAEFIPSSIDTISDDQVVDLPEELARIIPYYIKADMYEEEEPSLASLSRNLFESYLEEYRTGNDSTTRKVKAAYCV